MIDQLTTFFQEEPDEIALVLRHLQLSFVPVAAALLVAIPLGLFIGHTRKLQFITVTLANLGRAIPSFAILSLALILVIRLKITDFGFWSTFVALFFLSIPPLVVNTYTGVKNVDPDLVEAAKGQGLSGTQILRSVEIPLALPLVVAGLRTASVQSIATATLGALVAAGGLGDPIVFGFAAGNDASLIGGAFLVAVLAVAAEVVFAIVERVLRPRGVSTRRTEKVSPIEDLAVARTAPGTSTPFR